MLDILVCSLPGDDLPMSSFPEVRGASLARGLQEIGVRAEYRHLPCGPIECDALISSDYQRSWDEFHRDLETHLVDVKADKLFCMADYGTKGTGHFSKRVGEWFARRGGVLCHLSERPMEDYEYHIGIGVDCSRLRFDSSVERSTALFDFPKKVTRVSDQHGLREQLASTLHALKSAFPRISLAGSGPRDCEASSLFDRWIDYGTPHPEYLKIYSAAACFVVGCTESMGMQAVEAQVSGVPVLYQSGELRSEVLTPHGGVVYSRHDPASLIAAMEEAFHRDGQRIADQARRKFDLIRMARKTWDVIRHHGS